MKKIFTSVMAMAFAMTMSAQTPVSIKASCFNEDLIVEAVGVERTLSPTNAQVTDNHGCQYITQMYAEVNGGTTGIPMTAFSDGLTSESTKGKYIFQNPAQNNAIHIKAAEGCTYSDANTVSDKGTFTNEARTIEFESPISSSEYNTLGLAACVWLIRDVSEVVSFPIKFTLQYTDNTTEEKTVEVGGWCKWSNAIICSMTHRYMTSNKFNKCDNYIHEVALPFSKDLKAVTMQLDGNEESLWVEDHNSWVGGPYYGYGWVTASVFAASAWQGPAEITSVSFNGGKAGNWEGYSKQVSLELNEGKYTGELDLSDFTDNFEFKLVVNGGGDESDGWGGWIGTNNLTVDAPENWVVSIGDSDNQNCTLNNATTGYQTYTITATWEANPVYYKNWTVKIEGKDERTNAPENGYYLVGTMTDWALKADYIMTKNDEADVEEYTITKDLAEDAQFKVVKYEDGTQTWYPDGMGNSYGENGEMQGAGTYTIYFRPNGNGGEDWFNGVIYAVNTTGINNIAAETLKTAVIYNINGQRVSQPSRGLYIMNGKKVVLK